MLYKGVYLQLIIFIFSFNNITSAQDQDSIKESKNYFYAYLNATNYRTRQFYVDGKPTNDTYNYASSTNFAVDVSLNYRILIKPFFSLLTGVELVGRDNPNIDDSLKIDVSEQLIQIPLALGWSNFNEDQTMGMSIDLGGYLGILLNQQIIHPDNYPLPSYLKENYPAFSYYKYGVFMQFTGVFLLGKYKRVNAKYGICTGIRFFVESNNSAFGKSSNIVYTPAYSGASYFLGVVRNF